MPDVVLIAECDNIAVTQPDCLFEILNNAKILLVETKQNNIRLCFLKFLKYSPSLICRSVVTYDNLIGLSRLREDTFQLRRQKVCTVVSTHRDRDLHDFILSRKS